LPVRQNGVVRRLPIVTLLSDFGTEDPWVAQVRGVLLAAAAPCLPVDLTHQIPPGDVEAGAFFLGVVAPRFPVDAVHLAIVDPGVGGERRLLAVRAHGQIFLGPDNGLLEHAFSANFEARSLERTDLFASQAGATFHGRDRLAPAAAALLSGVAFEALGPSLTDPVRIPRHAPRRDGDGWTGRVAWIDRFGNLITDLPWTLLEEHPRGVFVVQGHAAHQRATHYAQIPPAVPAALRGSLGTVELALRGASLARAWGVARHAEVHFTGGPSATIGARQRGAR
jgi:S-adenosylmethionine hydrolase